ncbi:MAG TPA: fructose-bisphosphatase class II [Sphingomicrobium sp.]|nr:fructose-bisphosphatase class II [Sphingomicrobium sp.]
MNRAAASRVLDRVLVLEMVRVTEGAAITASKLIGRGDGKAADAAAVEDLRAALNAPPPDGTADLGTADSRPEPLPSIALL